MKIRILDSASQDLIKGFDFYEKPEAGLGSYFIDSLFADIDSLLVPAYIPYILDITACSPNDSRLPSTIK